ncbi:MAG: hypothetical protein JXQ96_08880 [Cyclobacteriaceae bacterium]
MSVHTNKFYRLLLLAAILLTASSTKAANGINLYTPYTNISVPPGESIDYTIEVINNGSITRTMDISVLGLTEEWVYNLKSGGWTVNQIAVLPGEKKSMTLNVQVPLNVDKGNHRFKVLARNYDTLPIVINVSEQGTFKSEFTSEQANMEGHAKSNFTFSTELKNHTGEKQLYSLRSSAPRGWKVTFKPNSKQATAVEIAPNEDSRVMVEVKPPHNIGAGTYKIPIRAVTQSTSAELNLEVVITGSFELELNTPTGLLSTKITAGDDKRIELQVKNTGSSDLKEVRFSASKPRNWDVKFEPDTLSILEAGKSASVFATLEADDKAIPGDYVTNIKAQTSEVSSQVAFRVLVKTSLLWGWLGIVIILGTLGAVYYLFQKYGRR